MSPSRLTHSTRIKVAQSCRITKRSGFLTDPADTCVGPADVVTFEIDGERIGQLDGRRDKMTTTVRAVGIGPLDLRAGPVPVAPKQKAARRMDGDAARIDQLQIFGGIKKISNFWNCSKQKKRNILRLC